MAYRKKIAAVVTTYFENSHADLIVSKFVNGFPYGSDLIKPEVDIVSLYMDQVHSDDIGLELAKKNDIGVYPSIRGCLTLKSPSSGHWPTSPDWEEGDLAVDGVLIIGEHGDYSGNERQRRMYPRKFLFEQVCGVISTSGKTIPVFNDKHLSYDWNDALWMYERAKALNVPFMAGSSLPLVNRDPVLEHPLGTEIEEALVLGYFNSYLYGLDSYGFHGLEAMQCMVERRCGGETGIAAVQCIEGYDIWKSASKGYWPRELADEAERIVKDKDSGKIEDNCKNPALFILEYLDGFRAYTLMLDSHVRGFAYAAKVNGNLESTSFNTGQLDHPFSYLCQNIQKMFITGIPQYPVERTLLVTGALEALMESKYKGHTRIETPHLGISYKPYNTPPVLPFMID